MNILNEIIEHKKELVKKQKQLVPFLEMLKVLDKGLPGPRFQKKIREKGVHLIAEVKKASPSAGIIRKDFDPVGIARSYKDAGADCLSILTEDRYFLGSLSHLNSIKKAISMPLLRKDFIVDIYQIYESKAHGADAVLFIAGLLDANILLEYLKIAKEIDIDALVEAHTKDELKMALDCGADIIGINTRNLKDLTIDPGVLPQLLGKIPEDKAVIAESGIKSVKDLAFLRDFRVNAVLVGEALMSASDTGQATEEFVSFLKEL